MDDCVRELMSDFQNGYLTHRGLLAKAAGLGLSAGAALSMLGAFGGGPAEAQVPSVQPKRWQKGKGWGWRAGAGDQLGNLNDFHPGSPRRPWHTPDRKGLRPGLMYDRRSFKWPGHSPGEILTFRNQQGEFAQRDLSFVVNTPANSLKTSFASCGLFVLDNIATQIDGYGHISVGAGVEAEYYNGFKAGEVLGNWGLMKLGAETIPPIVAPATMMNVAGLRRPGSSAEQLRHRARHAATRPGEAERRCRATGCSVSIRTGTAAVWMRGDGVGANQEEVARHDSAGISLAAARWLVEGKRER